MPTRLMTLVLFAALCLPALADTGKKAAPACPFCADCKCKACACKSIAGIWHVSGIDNDKKYAGVVTIQEVDGAPGVLAIHYVVGLSSTVGVGIRDGDRVSVSWRQRDGGMQGVTSYRLSADGKGMAGRWVGMPAGGAVTESRAEVLRFLRPSEDPEA